MDRLKKSVGPPKKRKPFGYSLHIDMSHCSEGCLNSIDLCTHFLNALVEFIGMHKQSEPSVIRTDSKKFQGKGGLSGSVMLAESSITIHTMSDTFFVSVDVYSCRKFDRRKVEHFVRSYCMPKKLRSKFIIRGEFYPD